MSGLAVRKFFGSGAVFALLGASAATLPTLAQADSDDPLRQRINALGTELTELRAQVEETERKADAASRAVESDANARVKWHLAGYAASTFVASDADGTNSSFGFGTFSPIFHFQYDDFFLFEAEPSLTFNDDGGTEIDLEYAQFNLILNDYVTLSAGKIVSPVGQFASRLHPAWINKLPDAPPGFGHDGIQPSSELGIQFSGGVPLGGDMVGTYAIAVGNGPRIGFHGIELEGFSGDNNQNKAVQGRFGFLPMPYLEFGGSFMVATAPGMPAPAGPVTEGDFKLWGVDAAYTRGPLNVRGELLKGSLGSYQGAADPGDAVTQLLPGSDWTAWYAQASYRLSGITDTPILKDLEPVIRYSEFDVDGNFSGEGQRQITIGLNYIIAPSIIAKVALQRRDFQAPGAANENRMLAQIAYGF